jgi:hypothetical protein
MRIRLSAHLPAPPSLWLAGLLTLLAAAPACAVDLFSFRDASGRILAFSVSNTEPVPATVDQTGATQAAIDWARRFYRLGDLGALAVEFETRPVRFWRVTLSASERGQTVHLYAAVLPDGRVVEPTVRDET